ncbi:MAG: septum formation initiator family protein [Flavobacteriaceae bacterium]|jgi:cell division protein FtsB|nr:septum formation initiator [Flavobacteriaceae bacterium]|tara:strand:+ start:909 stop:1208 length:300 start_codon:yes stop_codon:yes gene_type:complete
MKSKLIKFIKSTYGIIIILFIIWMIFFDSNSLLVHNDLNNDINKLNEQKSYYNSEIDKDKKELNMIQTDTGLEKYAREKLYMKKDNEDIFIIQFDTISE